MAVNVEIDSSGLVKKSDYTPAHSILVQQSGTGTPTALQVGNNTLVGRLSGGGSLINDLSATDVKTMLDIQISDVADLQDGLDTKQSIVLPLMPYDYWYETRFLNTNIVQPHLLGTAIASGTSTTAVPVISSNTLYPYGIFLRSSTSANGGFRFQSVLVNTDFFGGVAHKFQTAIMWKTAFTGRTVRVGYHDTANQNDAVDGAYFEILANVVNCKTANNSNRSTVTMVATLSLDVVYVFDIESNTDGTQIIYKLIDGVTGSVIETRTISTNIPNTSTRGFGVGLVATELSTTASDICVIYYEGNGTLNAFNRLRN